MFSMPDKLIETWLLSILEHATNKIIWIGIRSIKMATILRIEHPVRDFNAWKKVFDSDPLGRKKSGVRRYRIWRLIDNPNYVLMDLEFDGSKEAEAFASALRILWGSPEGLKVMQNPQLQIIEPVESRALKN